MIHGQELEDAITEMQGQRDPNANTCIKLAAYYVIRDHMSQNMNGAAVQSAQPSPSYSYAAPPEIAAEAETVKPSKDTEFFRTIAGKAMPDVLAVMDDCMTALNNTYPRLYSATIRRLQQV